MNSPLLRLCLCLLLLVCATTASAQEERSDTESGPPPGQQVGRNTSHFAPYPAPDNGYVTDLAGLLSQPQEEEIERWLWQTESRTGVEFAVVTIDSIRDYPATEKTTIESFATGLFDTYGIGNLPENNGVLLLVARRDRKARIELGAGYGRTRDGDAVRIMDNDIIPYFKQDAYAEGIRSGVKAVMLEFGGVRVGTNWPLIILLVAIPIVGAIAYSLFRSGKRGWGWVAVGLLIMLIMALLAVVATISRHMPQDSSGGWSSGGFGGGFGGGSSGGGGATGSW